MTPTDGCFPSMEDALGYAYRWWRDRAKEQYRPGPPGEVVRWGEVVFLGTPDGRRWRVTRVSRYAPGHPPIEYLLELP